MGLSVETFAIAGPCLITPLRHEDVRGWFRESYNASEFANAIGRDVNFVQDNESLSLAKGTLRGLHFQAPPFAQGKLVRVMKGKILDVIVDIRADSPTFGEHIAVALDDASGAQLWVPEGFAHGFVTRRANTHIAYKCTAPYARNSEGTIRWDDPALGIHWKIKTPILSDKDTAAPLLADIVSPFTYKTRT